jgi:hypothetical protein
MTSLDGILPQAARDLIRQYGSSVALNVTTETFDPVTQTGTQSFASVPTKAIPEAYKASEVQGDVQVNDFKLTFAALLATPKIGDHVTFRGQDGLILNVMPYFSGDAVAIYVCQVR